MSAIVVGGEGGPATNDRADLARWFRSRPTPKLIAAFLGANVVNRALRGRLRADDLAVAAAVVAAQPITELAIHTRLLHRRPTELFGRTIDPVAARDHRAHHEDPKDLEFVFIPLPTLLGGFAIMGGAVALVGGGGDGRRLATGGVVGAVLLATYEWCHYLMHTGYQPKGRWYRSRWRTHRLHHYRNEHYWYGVTTHLGDQLLQTYPARSDVPLSPTAKALHAG